MIILSKIIGVFYHNILRRTLKGWVLYEEKEGYYNVITLFLLLFCTGKQFFDLIVHI